MCFEWVDRAAGNTERLRRGPVAPIEIKGSSSLRSSE